MVSLPGLSSYVNADASRELVSGPLGTLTWHHVFGVCLFLWASYHQNRCHRILADLRKTPRSERSSNGSASYSVPYGDWFTYVSSPHYFAEILLYLGVSCVTLSGFWTDWSIFSFTFLALVVSARATHLWYLETFDVYKKLGRRVIIPYIY